MMMMSSTSSAQLARVKYYPRCDPSPTARRNSGTVTETVRSPLAPLPVENSSSWLPGY